MPELNEAVKAAAEERGVRVTPCGLNADWSVSAWALGSVTANRTDGAFYIVDDEEMGTISLVRRFYDPTELEVEFRNPYDDERYEEDGANDEIRPCRTVDSVDRVGELIDEFVRFVAWVEEGVDARPIMSLDLNQNVFGVLGLINRTLKTAGQRDRAKEFMDRAMSQKYDHTQLVKWVIPQYVMVVP